MLSQNVTTHDYNHSLYPINIMYLKPSNVLIFGLLIGGAAHVMIIEDGYWNDANWISVVLSISIPILGYQYLKISEQKKKVRHQKNIQKYR